MLMQIFAALLTSLLGLLGRISITLSLSGSLYSLFLAIQQWESRKAFSAQHCVIRQLDKWKQYLNQGLVCGVLPTYLSKALDCLSHELLDAKLILDYLTSRKQRSGNSLWKELVFGVPLGSVLGPLLCSIYLCNLFLFISNIDIASYADNTTSSVYGENISSTLESLEKAPDLFIISVVHWQSCEI